MRPARRQHFFLAATAATALSLSGCMAPASTGSGTASTAPAVQTASASSSPPSADARPTPTAQPSTSPAAAGPVTYTFPDGRLSFTHPAEWSVKYEQVAPSPLVETATVYDANGNGQINIYYSQVGDATAGPVDRTVIETDPVLGLREHSVPTPHSSFFVDRMNGAATYRMGLTAGLPVSPDGQVQHGPVKLGDRILSADVLFTGPPFAGDDAAKEWYWGTEGQALKSVLMSFSYR